MDFVSLEPQCPWPTAYGVGTFPLLKEGSRFWQAPMVIMMLAKGTLHFALSSKAWLAETHPQAQWWVQASKASGMREVQGIQHCALDLMACSDCSTTAFLTRVLVLRA